MSRHKVTFPNHYMTGAADDFERRPRNAYPFWTYTPALSRSDNALPYLGSLFHGAQSPPPYSTSFGSNASLPAHNFLSGSSSLLGHSSIHQATTPPALTTPTGLMAASTSPKWSLPFGHRMQVSSSSPPALLYEEADKGQTDELPILAFMSPEFFDEESRCGSLPS